MGSNLPILTKDFIFLGTTMPVSMSKVYFFILYLISLYFLFSSLIKFWFNFDVVVTNLLAIFWFSRLVFSSCFFKLERLLWEISLLKEVFNWVLLLCDLLLTSIIFLRIKSFYLSTTCCFTNSNISYFCWCTCWPCLGSNETEIMNHFSWSSGNACSCSWYGISSCDGTRIF